MSSDPDACLPQPIRDFVFDLHDSARRSQIPSEQSSLYNGSFRDITSKYFATSEWPSPEAVSSECENDELFLALYRELTQRHYHSISRVSARDRIEGWRVYRNLFDLLLTQADNAAAAAAGSEGGVGEGDKVGERGSKQPTAAAAVETLYILPEWAFDIMHEFVYQFQGFCQFRTTQAANYASTSGSDSPAGGAVGVPSSSGGGVNHETIQLLSSYRDAWAVETVLYYLHRLVAVGNNNNNISGAASSTTSSSSKAPPTQAHYVLGIFSSVALSRLECLLGDYRASLGALRPVLGDGDYVNPSMSVSAATSTAGGGGDDSSPQGGGGGGGGTAIPPSEVLASVFPARLSVAYHAGVSYLMLRRYKDASRALGDICAHMQRGFKTGQLRKLPGSEQFGKLFDRMIALLAILVHICPVSSPRLVVSEGSGVGGGGGGASGGGLEEQGVLRAIRDRFGSQLTKIESGEEGYEDLFMLACPKFVNPAVPDYDNSLHYHFSDTASSSSNNAQDVYKLQVRQFMNEMSCQGTLRKLRSYMKLYTSISVDKLAMFNDAQSIEFLCYLWCCKHKMRQLECCPLSSSLVTTADVEGDDDVEKKNDASDNHQQQQQQDGGDLVPNTNNNTNKKSWGAMGKDIVGSALDIHYYIHDDMIHVDEAEKQRRFEKFFLTQIAQSEEILHDLMNINTEV